MGLHLMRSYTRFSITRLSNILSALYSTKYVHEQIDYIETAIKKQSINWTELRKEVLNKPGSINIKNFEAILLRIMVNAQKYDTALSYARHLNNSCQDLNIGSINGLLNLYYKLGEQDKITDREKQFILQAYDHLYSKYKVLDHTTCEKLLHALCVINETDKAIKVLNDIYVTARPSHSAYSTIIASLFNNNRKTEALELVQMSISKKRPLLDNAYDAWIKYIFRNYKQKKTKLKHLEEIFWHISKNSEVISEKSAAIIQRHYVSIGCKAKIVHINRQNGQCLGCKESLQSLSLSPAEFQLLQDNIKEKLIIGSDLFLKTSPEELQRFLQFVKETAPYDVVLDALNVAFTIGKNHNIDRSNVLTHIVKYFQKRNKRILLLGRKHMLAWPKYQMQYLLANTFNFFTENVSQDDPYFITAAILSGSNTDIVSKDLLRGHQFNMKDELLMRYFQRWQWQHQWKVYVNRNGVPILQPPFTFTPCSQKTGNHWHIPFDREELDVSGRIHDGIPDWASWLCIQHGLSS